MATEQPSWDPETQCMDSTQMWFCRDLWTDAAKDGLKEKGKGRHKKLSGGHKRDIPLRHVAGEEREFVDAHKKRAEPVPETVQEIEVPEIKRDEIPEAKRAEDEQSSSDQDAIDEDASNPPPEPLKPQELPASAFLIPNTAFTAARILVNPRCVTTYGGVSHTQLALDLFGGERDEPQHRGGNYVLEDWAGPPDSFVCQEMRTTGGRTAPKSQRRVGFLLQNEVGI